MTQNKIHGDRPSSPRIHPLPPGERDAESRLLIDSIGSSGTDNTFNTLVRHPNLLRQWMPFTVALAVTGVLSPRLREIAILRTGWLCRAEYEWGQHAVLARKVGVSDEEIGRVKRGPEAEGWTELEAAVLRAADELHSDACITDEKTWAVLAAHLDERQLIEVPIRAPIASFLARNANLANVSSVIAFATRSQSSLAVPFQGWSVEIHPVRSTVLAPPRTLGLLHAFCARTDSPDSTPTTGFRAGASVGSEAGILRTRNVPAT